MPDRITYTVSCLAAKNKVVAFVTPDPANHSVHMHFFGEMFDQKRTPIQVKRARKKFPDASDEEIVRQTVTDFGPVSKLQITRLSKAKPDETTMTGVPVRIIVRFNK